MGVDARMYAVSNLNFTAKELRLKAAQLVAAIGKGPFWIDKKGEYGQPHHALSFEDGKIVVNLMGRYYGPGYERGYWPYYRSIGEWLEKNLQATVYYGNDSSDSFELFDESKRQELNNHFLSFGNEPYAGYFKSIWQTEPPLCEFCGDKPMHNVGGGGKKEFWHCDGCDTNLITNGEEKTEVEKFF